MRLWFICFVFFLFSCSSTEYVLQSLGTIELKSSEPVGNISDLLVTDQFFFATDTDNNVVHQFDRSGNYIQMIGRSGQGPGEFNRPVSLAETDEGYAVLDAGNSRITIFNKDNQFIRSFSVSGGRLSGIEYSKESHVFIISESLGIKDYFYYSSQGENLLENNILNKNQILLPVRIPGGQMSYSDDGNIWFSYVREYKLAKLNWTGEQLATFSASPKGYYPPRLHSKQEAEKYPDFGLILTPYELLNGLVISQRRQRKISSNSTDVNWLSYIDIFSPEGKIIDSISDVPLIIAAFQDTLYSISYSELSNLENDLANPTLELYTIQLHQDI